MKLFPILILFVGFAYAQERITNGDFESGTDPWTVETANGSAGTYDIDMTTPISGSASGHFTVDAVSGTGFELQFLQDFGAVVEGKRLHFTYTARASADVSINTWIQQNHDPFSNLYSQGISLTTDAQTFADSVDIFADDTNLKLTWVLGDLPVGTELWFDDVSIIETDIPQEACPITPLEVPGVEKIVNGFFEDGADPWELELQGGGDATYDLETANPIYCTSSAHVAITNSTGTDFHIQFKQQLDNVKAGSRYFIRFEARASEEVVVKASIQEFHDPYSFLSDKDFTITTDAQVFYDTSGVLAADDDNVKFTFFLGNIGNAEVWFDNITIIEYSLVEPLDIVIDAEKDDWYNGLSEPNDGLIYFPYRSGLTEAAFTLPEDDNDCSALLWAAWDTTYLYYYAEVTDDIVLVNNATTWQNDMIEVKYDPDVTVPGTSGALQTRMTAYGVDDAQDPTGVDDINADGQLMDTLGNVWEVSFDDYARGETSTGYILEWRVPLKYINTSTRVFSFGVGGVFGSAINVGDNDDVQREHMLQWSAGFADAVWSNPTLHGTVTFLAGNKLKYVAVSSHDETIVNDSAAVWYIPNFTAIEPDQISNIPSSFSLKQNYPNPFNPTTNIRYEINKTDKVSLTIYNITGEVVRNLISDVTQNLGAYEIVWDSKDNRGTEVSSGVYFFQIKQGTTVATKKMVLMR